MPIAIMANSDKDNDRSRFNIQCKKDDTILSDCSKADILSITNPKAVYYGVYINDHKGRSKILDAKGGFVNTELGFYPPHYKVLYDKTTDFDISTLIGDKNGTYDIHLTREFGLNPNTPEGVATWMNIIKGMSLLVETIGTIPEDKELKNRILRFIRDKADILEELGNNIEEGREKARKNILYIKVGLTIIREFSELLNDNEKNPYKKQIDDCYYRLTNMLEIAEKAIGLLEFEALDTNQKEIKQEILCKVFGCKTVKEVVAEGVDINIIITKLVTFIGIKHYYIVLQKEVPFDEKFAITKISGFLTLFETKGILDSLLGTLLNDAVDDASDKLLDTVFKAQFGLFYEIPKISNKIIPYVWDMTTAPKTLTFNVVNGRLKYIQPPSLRFFKIKDKNASTIYTFPNSSKTQYVNLKPNECVDISYVIDMPGNFERGKEALDEQWVLLNGGNHPKVSNFKATLMGKKKLLEKEVIVYKENYKYNWELKHFYNNKEFATSITPDDRKIDTEMGFVYNNTLYENKNVCFGDELPIQLRLYYSNFHHESNGKFVVNVNSRKVEETVNLNKGLVAHYEFEGNVNDNSGNGNNGTEYGKISYVDGVIGKAGSFDRNYIIVPNSNSLQFNQEFSISFWFNTQSNIGMDDYGNVIDNGRQAIIAKSGDRAGFVIHTEVDINTDLRYPHIFNGRCCKSTAYWLRFPYDEENKKYISSGIPIKSWHNIVYFYKNGIMSVYVDGKLINISEKDKFYIDEINARELHIGIGEGRHWYPYYGYIDDIRIYNRALNETEIKELYNLGQVKEAVDSNNSSDNGNNETEHGSGNNTEIIIDNKLSNFIRENLKLSENTKLTKHHLLKVKRLKLKKRGLSNKNIKELKKLTNLRILDLSDNNISDISPLKELTKLKLLNLSKNKIEDISPLSDIVGLKYLRLDYNPIKSDLETLSKLINLKRLFLNHTQTVGNLTALSNIVNMEYLYLNDSKIEGDILALSKLHKLKMIYLSGLNIEGDISIFSNMSNIVRLYLQKTKVTGNISALSDLINLKRLYLHKTKVTGDLEAISNMLNMKYLKLNNTKIVGDISNLSNLINLKYIYLHNTKVTGNIADLSDLINLERLYLYNTLVEGDLSSLLPLKKLIYIKLKNTKITGSL